MKKRKWIHVFLYIIMIACLVVCISAVISFFQGRGIRALSEFLGFLIAMLLCVNLVYLDLRLETIYKNLRQLEKDVRDKENTKAQKLERLWGKYGYREELDEVDSD